jgi:hypothetical protein
MSVPSSTILRKCGKPALEFVSWMNSQVLQVVASTSILRSAYQRRTIFSCAAGGSRRSRGGSYSTYRWFLLCLSPSPTLLQPARWVQCLICQMAQSPITSSPCFSALHHQNFLSGVLNKSDKKLKCQLLQ